MYVLYNVYKIRNSYKFIALSQFKIYRLLIDSEKKKKLKSKKKYKLSRWKIVKSPLFTFFLLNFF